MRTSPADVDDELGIGLPCDIIVSFGSLVLLSFVDADGVGKINGEGLCSTIFFSLLASGKN
jgi:hypothetical protein